ncbi:hypothetical protein VNO77_01093 [Canavalia gladiata]|uniref:Uncharacterized protein n=1 Tax=Canavalia gladiata TaxID=3824 RepID=A0AAN9MRA6_CANGL
MTAALYDEVVFYIIMLVMFNVGTKCANLVYYNTRFLQHSSHMVIVKSFLDAIFSELKLCSFYSCLFYANAFNRNYLSSEGVLICMAQLRLFMLQPRPLTTAL